MSSLPAAVHALVARTVGAVTGVAPVGGGDTSRAARVETAGGAVFAKWGDAPAGASYAAEAEGLDALAVAAPAGLDRPDVLALRAPDADGPGAIVLRWIRAAARPDRADWRAFGARLAGLHAARVPSTGYGWHADNWIGSKPQRNAWVDDWPSFFGEYRLLAQARTVRECGAWDAAWDAPLDRMVARLPDLLPRQPERALVHGDLWAGNVMPQPDGRFALIDPAVYVGDGVVDLAMMHLFGGFGDAQDGYAEARPLPDDWRSVFEVYNLYHLINHLTHGGGYRAPVEATLRRYGG